MYPLVALVTGTLEYKRPIITLEIHATYIPVGPPGTVGRVDGRQEEVGLAAVAVQRRRGLAVLALTGRGLHVRVGALAAGSAAPRRQLVVGPGPRTAPSHAVTRVHVRLHLAVVRDRRYRPVLAVSPLRAVTDTTR